MFLRLYGYVVTHLVGLWALIVQVHRLSRGPNKRFNFFPQEGKVFIVTGGLNGIGRAISERLMALGGFVVITGREPPKSHRIARSLEGLATLSSKFLYVQLDLTSMSKVVEFCDLVKDRFTKVDALFCNAGTMDTPYSVTVDGFESHMAVNYLSNVLMVHHLKDHLSKSDSPRVVLLSSAAHKVNYINFNDFMFSNWYCPYLAYSQSKLCQVVYAKYICQQLLTESRITVNAVHPGVAATSLYRGHLLLSSISQLLFISPQAAAETALFAALAPDMEGVTGQYLEDSTVYPPSSMASDNTIQKTLLTKTESCLQPWM